MQDEEFAHCWRMAKERLGTIPVPVIILSLRVWHDPEDETGVLSVDRLVQDPVRWPIMREDLEFLMQDPQLPVAEAAQALLAALEALRQGDP